MDCYTLIVFVCLVVNTAAWSRPFYAMHRFRPIRVTRFAPLPPRHVLPVRPAPPAYKQEEQIIYGKPKREEDEDHEDHTKKSTTGIVGPVHTYVKTDKNANYKWGVRHHVGRRTS